MVQHLIDPVISQLEQALPKYLTGRRWFRSKAQNIAGSNIQDVVEADGFLILVVKVSYASGTEELYLMPVSTAEEGAEDAITTFETEDGKKVSVHDAVASPFFRNILFRALSSGGNFQGRSGLLHAEPLGQPQEGELVRESSVSKAEQSNTSIIYGHDFILKLFRKIEPGINPDIEIGAFLTARGFENTPAVVGTLEYRTQEGETCSAGILQEFVANKGDAWKFTLDALGEYYARAMKSNLDSTELLGTYSEAAKLLGVRTAQMHAVLASDDSNPDFVPEPFAGDDAQKLSDEVGRQAASALELLRAKAKELPSAEADLAARVLKLEQRIFERIREIASLKTDIPRIRHHGDYHLGQVLFTGSDFMIIDFEGEPARPLSERRTKALGLRDVAGMLRSFQYAAYAGLYGLVPGLPSDPASSEKVAECSAFWNSEVSKLYLDAYYSEAGMKPPEAFLDAFLLQKALYEVQYELNNRPAWVGIPLRGILSLMES